MPLLLCSFLTLVGTLIFIPILGWAASIPLQNITIIAPVGTTQHGDDHLLCVPTRPWDILVFILANYLAHAVTVQSYPGESSFDLAWGTVAAVLSPTSGMIRGITAIMRRGWFSGSDPRKAHLDGTPLQTALCCGALCMVVRTKDWKPLPGVQLSQLAVTSRDPMKAVRRRWFQSKAYYQELNGRNVPYATFPNMFPAAAPADPPRRSRIFGIPVPRVHPAISFLISTSPVFGVPWSLLLWASGEPTVFEQFDKVIQPAIPDATTPHIPLDDVFSSPRSATSSRNTYLRATYRTYVPQWLKDTAPWMSFPDTFTVTTGNRSIHGNQNLPEGYAFAFVPRKAKVVSLDIGNDGPTVPRPQAGFLKGVATFAQAMYAIYTLYMARGDQISRYGYTAFGLTVLPYAVMSTINLLGALVTPEFDEMYLVESDTLLEARAVPGARFEGVVGRLLPAAEDLPTTPRLCENVFSGVVERDAGSDSLRIEVAGYEFDLVRDHPNSEGPMVQIPACGKFQRFKNDKLDLPSGWPRPPVSSTSVFISYMGQYFTRFQRVWIPVWLVAGAFYGGITTWMQFQFPSSQVGSASKVAVLLIGSVPAIGGFWAVGQMLMQYERQEQVVRYGEQAAALGPWHHAPMSRLNEKKRRFLSWISSNFRSNLRHGLKPANVSMKTL
ncbi:hypothetical protein FB451DRAFT_1190675 [Mycena latifolia]|nr:hypothetical protein FB451DRAFT_1190675 [Mycena latifolia]